ncbi:SDR family oxidoreductase [Thalassotalea ganghwensis]
MIHQKVVIVTGGGRGIGAATAKLFAQHDYAVCINYRSNHESANQVVEEIKAAGGHCVALQADVSKEADVVRLFNEVDQQLGMVNVLVNNVGMLRPQKRLEQLTAERINNMLINNVTSYFLCSREAVKRMSTKSGGLGGAIVNVSSAASRTGAPNEYVDYAASKGAIDTLTTGLAMEVAAEGIRVNCVRPGLIYTDMHRDGGEPGRVDRLASKIPLQRGGQASEVAEAILWLASDKASFSTNNFLDLAGGL